MEASLTDNASYSQLRPPRQYPRRAPNVFNAISQDTELLRWFYRLISEPSVEVPSEGFIYLPHCYAFDGRFLLDDELNWVEPTLADWAVGDDVKQWIGDSIKQGAATESNQSGTEWYYVLFAQCNAENYGHFLCEAAPKLLNIFQAGFKKVRYILPANCAHYQSFISDILTHIGIVSEAVIIPKASITGWSDLLYFTPVSQHDFRKSPTLLEFRDVALSRFGHKGAATRKFLIQRAEIDRRRVANDRELAASLDDLGYEAVYPGKMTIGEQIDLFSQASDVVGSVGAGLTNIVYCPSEVRTVYVCNGLIDPFFWDISGLCEQSFTWFFACPPQRFSQAHFIRNYDVDLPSLRAAIAQS